MPFGRCLLPQVKFATQQFPVERRIFDEIISLFDTDNDDNRCGSKSRVYEENARLEPLSRFQSNNQFLRQIFRFQILHFLFPQLN